MLTLQLIASMGLSLQSFDIKSAFLQGNRDDAGILGLEPVKELREMMHLTKKSSN